MPSNLSTVFIQGQCHSSLCHAVILIISPSLKNLHFKQSIRENSQISAAAHQEQNSAGMTDYLIVIVNTGNERQKIGCNSVCMRHFELLVFLTTPFHKAFSLSMSMPLSLCHPTAYFPQCLYVSRLQCFLSICPLEDVPLDTKHNPYHI